MNTGEKNKALCVIQARMSSTRLPGKVLKKVNGTPLLEYQIKRVRLAKRLDKIIVATTAQKGDDAIKILCDRIGIDCFRGSEDDVLDRYYKCVQQYPGYDTVVRLTSDCPLIDPYLIDEFVGSFDAYDVDYLNSIEAFGKETFPEGVADIDVFTKGALEKAALNARLSSEREHVTLYFHNNPDIFKKAHIAAPKDYSYYRMTVDTFQDFGVVKFIMENSSIGDSYLEYVHLLDGNKEIAQKSMKSPRLEGLDRSLRNDRIIK